MAPILGRRFVQNNLHTQLLERNLRRAQQVDRFIGHEAEGTAAVGDDLFSLGQLPEPFFELVDRNVDGPRDMAGRELLGGPNVENGHQATAGTVEQLRRGNGLEIVFRKEVEPDNALDFRIVSFANPRERGNQGRHLVSGDAIEDKLSLLAPDDETCLAQLLQML